MPHTIVDQRAKGMEVSDPEKDGKERIGTRINARGGDKPDCSAGKA